MESGELFGVPAGDAAEVGGVEVRRRHAVINNVCRRPAACWLSGDLDDLTERLEHCSERCCRAVLVVSHAQLCLHGKTAAMAILVAFGGMRGDRFSCHPLSGRANCTNMSNCWRCTDSVTVDRNQRQ